MSADGSAHSFASSNLSSVCSTESLKRKSTLYFHTDSSSSDDSEQSYEPLLKKTHLFEELTHLTFNLRWMFTAAFANVIIFMLFTYEHIFDSTVQENVLVLIVHISCTVILITDVAAAFLHSVWKKYSSLRNLVSRGKLIATLDVIGIVWLLLRFIPAVKKNPVCATISFTFIVFRFYRVVRFFYVVSMTPGLDSVDILLKKYSIILFIIVHALACTWQYLGCYKCNYENWTSTVDGSLYLDGSTPFKWYIVCIYYMLSAITSVGFGDIHEHSTIEQILSILAMLIGFVTIAGAFLGAWTTVQVESYRRHALFSHRYKEIAKFLEHPKVTKYLKNKILNYYITFWTKQNGIRRSHLFEILPDTMKSQVYFEKYCAALTQTYLLKNLSLAFQRAIASAMITEIYTLGEIIYTQGKEKDFMIYVLQGDIQILSAEDGESPILTLGVGTIIGEINLIYTFESPVQVIASSYSVIQCLTKSKFWNIAINYQKLGQMSHIWKRLDKKVADARELLAQKELILLDSGTSKQKTLKLVKTSIKTESTIKSLSAHQQAAEKVVDVDKTTTYSDLYVASLRQTTLKHSDEICLHTTWPWILQSESVLLYIWEYVVCFAVVVVALLYPYQIAFRRSFPPYMMLIRISINTIYVADVIFKIFTAIVDDNGVILTSMSDIFAGRFRQLSFILDVLATLPITTLATTFQLTENPRLIVLLETNRLIKMHRVILLLHKLGGSFYVNVALIRCLKYVLYFLVLSYFMGSIFYMIACFYEECKQYSWFTKIQDSDLVAGTDRSEHMFQVSLYFAVMILSQAGFGDVTPYNVIELIIAMVFFIIGTAIFSYLVADYSATVMLSERSRSDYIELVYVIRRYQELNQMLSSIQERTNNYLTLQWFVNSGYYIIKDRSMMYDTPRHLYEEQRVAKYFDILKNIPIFQSVEISLVRKMAALAKVLFLPPNETVIYAGEIVYKMYVIDGGYCEVTSAASGRVEKILGPDSHFCSFEMLLRNIPNSLIHYITRVLIDIPGINNIRTLTHVRILQIKYEDIRKLLVTAKMMNQVSLLTTEAKQSLGVQRLFMVTSNVDYILHREDKRDSWFVYPNRKLHPRYIDLEKGFDSMGFWKCFRGFLLHRTIIPDGNFLMVWEMVQAIRIFVMGLYIIALPVYKCYYFYYTYLWVIFDIIGYIDIYIRMHICYYDSKGILVTHPRYTAIRYLTHGFIIDVLSLLPTTRILKLMTGERRQAQQRILSIESILRLNRLLQLYRIPQAFSFFERDIFNETTVILNIFKYIPISIVVINALAIILLTISCTMRYNKDKYIELIPLQNSWIQSNHEITFDIKEPFYLYIAAYYWISCTALSLGFGDIGAHRVSEIYFVIIVIIIGYLFFTHTLVTIASSKASININLAIYQEHMRHLIVYMNGERIPRDLRQRAINHFEYLWQRTHGMKARTILKKCHLALHEDAVLYLYESTFIKVPIFTDTGRPFYRLLGMHVEEAYYLKHSTIIRLNDIISTIYIVHRGEVLTVGPDGSIFCRLTRGSMFGNLDNVRNSRSSISVVAHTAVDLLCIETEELYVIASDYSLVNARLHKHILQNNTAYIQVKEIDEMEVDSSLEKIQLNQMSVRQFGHFSKLITHIYTGTFRLPMILMSFFSCIVVTYHLAFQTHGLLTFLFTYGLDLIHLIKLYMGFSLPYQNRLGEVVTDPKHIRDKFLTSSKFYIDLFGLLPLEIFALLAPSGQILYYLTWLRMNRLIRMSHINAFFDVTFDRLNINVLVIKLGSICIYFVLMVHIGTCLLYMLACPGAVCRTDSWIYDKDGNKKCSGTYICPLYFLITIVTFTGFGNLCPRTVAEVLICTGMMILGKFLMACFIGDMSAIVQNYSYTLVTYNYNSVTLKYYLKSSYIAGPLVTLVMHYVNQLWTIRAGSQIPVLLNEAPSYLIEDLKIAAYGKHLFENFLFVSCHRDFLRLLIAKLQSDTYFRGDIICQQGDINDKMYFIHKGTVNVYAFDGHENVQIDTLGQLDCFSLVQGLIASTPHSHTYKANTVAVILTLKLQHWAYLLGYYRASRFEIYDRIQKMADLYVS